MDIKEVTNKIEKSFNGNGLLIVGGGFVLLFIIVYMMQSKNSSAESTTQITGAYSSYPDTVTNADEITGTLQESTDAQTETIIDEMSSQMSDIFTSLGELTTQVGNIQQQIDTTNTNESADVNEYTTLESNGKYARLNTIETNMNKTTMNVNRVINDINEVSTYPINSSSGTVKQGSGSYFTQANYTGSSLSDALNSIGEYKNTTNRSLRRIAKVNGINNYTGSTEQESELLNKLKNGKLKRG